MTQEQEKAIIDLLWDSLAKDTAHQDRRCTGWGTKTQTGLIACIERITATDFGPPRIEAVGNRDKCGRCLCVHGGNDHYCTVHGLVSEGCCLSPGCDPADWETVEMYPDDPARRHYVTKRKDGAPC